MTIRVKKNLKIDTKSLTEDEKYHYFSGYASVFNVTDRDNDVIIPAAYDKVIKDFNEGKISVKVLFVHDYKQPIGVISEMKADDHGLFVTGKMPKSDTIVRDRVMPQMEVGSLDSMSVGIVITDWGMTKDVESNPLGWTSDVRIIKSAHLDEVSLVPLAANTNARITSFKSVVPYGDLPLADREREWDSAAAISRVREFTDSVESPSQSYKRAFLWYDAENSENFGAYKLPVADVIDGRLTAVPRGVFAAAAAMRGARGGVDIPDADRAGVIANINRYYAKLGLESPFEQDQLDIDDIKSLTERELEKRLRSGSTISKSAAKTIVGLISKSGLRDAEPVVRDAQEEKMIEQLEIIGLQNRLNEVLKKMGRKKQNA